MKNNKSYLLFLIFVMLLSGCSFSFDTNKDQKISHSISIEEALANFSKSEIENYITSNYFVGEIYESGVDFDRITWDEIAGNEYRDRNGEELWEYVARVLEENEKEQNEIAEAMAEIEAELSQSSSSGKFDFSDMRQSIIENEIPMQQVHGTKTIEEYLAEHSQHNN